MTATAVIPLMDEPFVVIEVTDDYGDMVLVTVRMASLTWQRRLPVDDFGNTFSRI